MRAYLVNSFSMILMALGFISILWVSSSLSGRASSQTPPPAVPLGAAASEAAATNVGSPTEMGLPAMLEGGSGVSAADILTDEYAPSSLTTEGYIYDPTGRRDPFKSIIPEPEQQKAVAPTGEVTYSADPLQAFELGQYKVIGIVWDINTPRAMVKDPQGKLYTLKKETKIGRNNGFVSSIREGAVLVVEPAFGEGGTQTAVTRVMLLAK